MLSEMKSDHSKQVVEYFDGKNSNLNSLLNNTDLFNSELKTSQIKVVARFRPINFVEEVFFSTNIDIIYKIGREVMC